MTAYLRNRPFMVISYNYVLAAGQKSNVKGFGATAQWEPIENMVICDSVNNKALQRAELVIDLFENKVVKCRDNTLDHAKLIETFVSRHYEEVKAALATWIQKDPANMSKVRDFVARFAKKEERPVPTMEQVVLVLEEIVEGFRFEMNDEQTRGKIVHTITQVLQHTPGIKDYAVACDEMNNTPERIENNELWVDAGVQFETDENMTYIPLRLTKEPASA